MATAVLNKANQQIGQLTKKFSYPHHYGGGKTVSAIKNVLVVTTDKESLKNSFSIIKDVEEFISKLPVKISEVKESVIKKQVITTNQNLHSVNSMLNDIFNVINNDGGKIQIDDVNMQSFITNIVKVKEGLQYISDYLSLIAQTIEAKKEIKNGNHTIHTLESLLAHIKAA